MYMCIYIYIYIYVYIYICVYIYIYIYIYRVWGRSPRSSKGFSGRTLVGIRRGLNGGLQTRGRTLRHNCASIDDDSLLLMTMTVTVPYEVSSCGSSAPTRLPGGPSSRLLLLLFVYLFCFLSYLILCVFIFSLFYVLFFLLVFFLMLLFVFLFVIVIVVVVITTIILSCC